MPIDYLEPLACSISIVEYQVWIQVKWRIVCVNIYFQDTDKSLVTQLRAYSSLIIFRIQERFNPSNVSSETTSHSLTDDLSDLDPWTRDLVGVVDLGPEDPKESYIDYLVEKYR